MISMQQALKQRIRSRGRELNRFNILKQLELSLAARIIWELGKKTETPEEVEKILASEVPKEELQRINEAALLEGRQPLSFEFKQ